MDRPIIIHEDLRYLISTLQEFDCRAAKEHAEQIGEWIKQLIRMGTIDVGDDMDRLRLIEDFSYIQMVFENFIPPTNNDNEDEEDESNERNDGEGGL